MTTQELFQNELIGKGMSQQQASDVMKYADEKMKELGTTVNWQSSSFHYPNEVILALRGNINMYAKEWLAEHKPMAWFRPMFN